MKAVIGEFEKNPEADMILFNVDVPKERRTYHSTAMAGCAGTTAL